MRYAWRTRLERSIRIIMSSTGQRVRQQYQQVTLAGGHTLLGYQYLRGRSGMTRRDTSRIVPGCRRGVGLPWPPVAVAARSEEHTSELQSRGHLVCRLLR